MEKLCTKFIEIFPYLVFGSLVGFILFSLALEQQKERKQENVQEEIMISNSIVVPEEISIGEGKQLKKITGNCSRDEAMQAMDNVEQILGREVTFMVTDEQDILAVVLSEESEKLNKILR